MVSHRSFNLIILFTVFVGGCSTPLPPAAEPAQARSALTTALDAWQKGETAESLQARSPAIHVNDPGWSSGERLVKYEIQAEQAHGQGWKVQVLLTLQSGGGAASNRQVNYTIDTEPAVVIVRDVE
ncbi:MAG: hypothetical protein IAF94_03840 [Pirellulaceae bacterium]|nr:hypothetical protein [Pirellulaceae bacterium]